MVYIPRWGMQLGNTAETRSCGIPYAGACVNRRGAWRVNSHAVSTCSVSTRRRRNVSLRNLWHWCSKRCCGHQNHPEVCHEKY
jgi:hypothetical protein